MSVIIDVVLVLIVGFCVWRGWRNGIIRGICGVLALILSLYGANLLASTFSGEFTSALRPFVGGVVDSAVSSLVGAPEDDEEPQLDEGERRDVFTVAFSVLRRLGVAENLAERLSAEVTEESGAVDRNMAASITDKLCASLAYVAVFAICFLLLSIVFALIGNLLNFVFSIPGIETIDSAVGMVFGLLKGLLIVLVIAVVLRYPALISPETLEETVVLKYLINRNLVAQILGL